MKETEVRERATAFLKNTVRQVVIPASMGIGLVLVGCGGSLYGAPFPNRLDAPVSPSLDGRPDHLSAPVPEYAGPLDTREYRPDGPTPLYAGPMPDAADALDAAVRADGRDGPSADADVEPG